MKSDIYYQWEKDDPSLVFVTEAINLLANFKYDSDEFYQKSHNRVVIDKRFTADDIRNLDYYLRALAERAREKYAQASDADPFFLAVKDSVIQNAERAEGAAKELRTIFAHALESL